MPTSSPWPPGELARTESVDVKALKTRPPARYTEATLLSAMEGAGKLIDDDELREAMQEKGLGTPATRAAIIEGLIYEKYIHREGRELVPGAKAFQLMTLLRGLGVEDLTKPELTGNWEYQLAEMEKGQLERETFMKQIAEMAERIVRKAKEYDRDTIPGDYATLARRARTAAAWSRRTTAATPASAYPGQPRPSARAAAFRSARSRAGAPSSWPRSRRSCATSGSARSRASARRRAGRSRPSSSSCATTRSSNWKLEFDFGEDARREGESGEPVDFGEQEPLGHCPKTQGNVYEFGANYVCEHSVGAGAIVRLQERQGDPAAAGRARADDQAARDRRDRPARRLRLQQDAAQVQGAPGLGREGRQGRVRVRAAARAPGRRAQDRRPGAARRGRRCRSGGTGPRRRGGQEGGREAGAGHGGRAAAKKAAKKAARKAATSAAKTAAKAAAKTAANTAAKTLRRRPEVEAKPAAKKAPSAPEQ